MLDLNAERRLGRRPARPGLPAGFGIDVQTRTQIGDESDPRIVGHDVTDGAEEGGRTAMENLLQKDPSINLVYTINEPAAAGAYEALKAAGKEKDVTIVSVDGGCPGVDSVKAAQIGATSQQYPLKMAEQGVEAIAAFAKDGNQAGEHAGNTFVRHRRQPDHLPAADGVDSKDTAGQETAGADVIESGPPCRPRTRGAQQRSNRHRSAHPRHASTRSRIVGVHPALLHANPTLGARGPVLLRSCAFSTSDRGSLRGQPVAGLAQVT
jgi:hypothetical protein